MKELCNRVFLLFIKNGLKIASQNGDLRAIISQETIVNIYEIILGLRATNPKAFFKVFKLLIAFGELDLEFNYQIKEDFYKYRCEIMDTYSIDEDNEFFTNPEYGFAGSIQDIMSIDAELDLCFWRTILDIIELGESLKEIDALIFKNKHQTIILHFLIRNLSQCLSECSFSLNMYGLYPTVLPGGSNRNLFSLKETHEIIEEAIKYAISKTAFDIVDIIEDIYAANGLETARVWQKYVMQNVSANVKCEYFNLQAWLTYCRSKIAVYNGDETSVIKDYIKAYEGQDQMILNQHLISFLYADYAGFFDFAMSQSYLGDMLDHPELIYDDNEKELLVSLREKVNFSNSQFETDMVVYEAPKTSLMVLKPSTKTLICYKG